MSDSADRARALRELHRPGDPLILVNVWDAASARVVAAAPGCRAVATASWSIAAAHGYADGEQIPRELMLKAVKRIVAAVDLPVTADLESGFGETPAAVADTVARALEGGAVGVNLEDRLRPVGELVAVVDAVRACGEREGVPVVVNARSDEFLLGEKRLEEALARGRAYLDAGADCFFIPGLADLEQTRRLVAELDAPVNILARPGAPSVEELAGARVARISVGPGGMGAAYSALAGAAAAVLGREEYPADLAFRPPAG